MRKFSAALIAIALGPTLAFAGDRLTQHEYYQIKYTLHDIGCHGGEIEKERRGYEIDDAQCYGNREADIELDHNFRIRKVDYDD